MKNHLIVLALCLVLRVWWQENTSLLTYHTTSGIVQSMGGGWVIIKRDDTGLPQRVDAEIITASNWEEETSK